jgi:hypothetical protein
MGDGKRFSEVAFKVDATQREVQTQERIPDGSFFAPLTRFDQLFYQGQTLQALESCTLGRH